MVPSESSKVLSESAPEVADESGSHARGGPIAQVPAQVNRKDGGARIGILVAASGSKTTLHATLDRIPEDFRRRIAEVIVLGNPGNDGAYIHGETRPEPPDMPQTLVVANLRELGYGGIRKEGYKLALERGLDIVVLLQGDGRYPPELLPEMVALLERGECDAVLGSRMMDTGAACGVGMPRYKRIGNMMFTRVENALLGTALTEFHCGYRAYSAGALREIPFERNADNFDFDTQIIIQLHHAGKRIVEIPFPAYYGDQIGYADGVRYARNSVRDAIEYRLTVMGFGNSEWTPKPEAYAFKDGDSTSHAVILAKLVGLPRSRILDLGCSSGLFAAHARAAGHEVTGVDCLELPGVLERTDRFVKASLEDGIPDGAGDGFDVIVAADVIEHLSRPDEVLRDMRKVLRPGGRVLLSVPNFAHWYPRMRVAAGLFGYDRRGILDETHLRFFTRATLRRFVRASGFDIVDEQATGLPLGVVAGTDGRKLHLVRKLDELLVRARPTLFGYQIVMTLTPQTKDSRRAEQVP